MKKLLVPVLAGLALSTTIVAAQEVTQAPPPAPYQAVSALVELPEFLPGLGQLFVDPATLPAGPFLAYDHDGQLVSTIYMIPVDQLSDPDTKLEDLAAPGGTVDHVDVYFNAGHPGVEVPHSHVVLWHVPAADEARVARMSSTRRDMLKWGGGVFATLVLPAWAAGQTAQSGSVSEIRMIGRPDGSRVTFDPIGLLVQPGTTVRWINQDRGNSHTATAYHPDLFDRQQRIPDGAEPWDTDYLLPEEGYDVHLTEPGVYDYYCLPHEHAGMVGRIIVGPLPDEGWWTAGDNAASGGPPRAALDAFPSVEAILRNGLVRGEI